jgi:hypothetical protein
MLAKFVAPDDPAQVHLACKVVQMEILSKLRWRICPISHSSLTPLLHPSGCCRRPRRSLSVPVNAPEAGSNVLRFVAALQA